MEHIGSEFIVILNDAPMRQSVIRDIEDLPRSGQGAKASQVVRRWFAQALHGLASRVAPASDTVDRPRDRTMGGYDRAAEADA